ncbi:MAG: hypothetical protein NZT92_14280 [Abditibacteriales bacterium]|nr:hypothetical protein [Abditibacteriales bacterium]MDW8367080.1 hypothetical protein [Abditibacteriales bacterium]
MRWLSAFVMMGLLLGIGGWCLEKCVADEATRTSEEGAAVVALRRLVEQQQKIIEAQQKRLEELEKRLNELHPPSRERERADPTHAHKDMVRSGLHLKFYGFLRADVEADSRRMSLDSQFPIYVLSPADPSQAQKQTGELTMHPRLTRFGFDLNAPTIANSWQPTAKMEMDFFNVMTDRPAPANPDLAPAPNNPSLPRDLTSASRAVPRIRQAYVRLQKGDFFLLLGQTWDLISPLCPCPNWDSMMWNAGNTGDRRPQLRFGYEPKRGRGQWSFGGMVGASSVVDGQDLDGDGFRDGEGAATPTLQARVGYTAPSRVKGQNWSAGVWGHLAHQEVNRFLVGGKSNFSSHLLGVDFTVPLSQRLKVIGEVWTGKNLCDVRGGIGQGIDVPTGREVSAKGGWIEGQYRLNSRHTFILGATLDQPDGGDLTPASARTRNATYYLGNRYNLSRGLTLGLDWIHWQTQFKALPKGTNNRVTFFIQNDF